MTITKDMTVEEVLDVLHTASIGAYVANDKYVMDRYDRVLCMFTPLGKPQIGRCYWPTEDTPAMTKAAGIFMYQMLGEI